MYRTKLYFSILINIYTWQWISSPNFISINTITYVLHIHVCITNELHEIPIPRILIT